MADPVEAARVLEVEWLNGNVTDGAHDRIEAAIRADVVPTGDAGRVAWHIEPDPRGGYLVYVAGYDPSHVDDATDALILGRAKAHPTGDAGLDVERLRAEFLRLLTTDSETKDRRRREFNQAIFNGEGGWAVWSSTDLDMVMSKFDRATRLSSSDTGGRLREYCVICGDDGHHGDEHHDVIGTHRTPER